jgi:hypothetical protein
MARDDRGGDNMPTNRKRSRRPSQAKPWITEYLLYGFYTLPNGERSIRKTLLYGEPDVPAWAEVRDELLPRWIREHPCTRPWAWWEQEAPEPRAPGETEADYLLRHKFLSDGEILAHLK